MNEGRSGRVCSGGVMMNGERACRSYIPFGSFEDLWPLQELGSKPGANPSDTPVTPEAINDALIA